jgi:hypothetical protein
MVCGAPNTDGPLLGHSILIPTLGFLHGSITGTRLKVHPMSLTPIHNLSGWWLKNHLEKYEFVNGKDDIPLI